MTPRLRLSGFGVALAGLVSIATPALAHNVSCSALATDQPNLRKEAVAQPVGDVLLTCGGTVSGTLLTGPQTLSLSGDVVVASRQLYSPDAAPTHIPTGAELTVASGTPTQGFLENGALVFSGFTLPVGTHEMFQIRLTGIRVDPSKLSSGSSVTGEVLASFPVMSQSRLVLGVVDPSLNDSAGWATNLPGVKAASGAHSVTAQSSGTPSAVSVTPSSGSGLQQLFSFVFSDPLGYQDLAWQQIVINSSLSPNASCFIFYSPSNNSIYLYNDNVTVDQGPGILGSSGFLQNSQCILNLASSSAVGSGNNLTLNLALSFESGFTGAKTIYADVASNEGLSSGWVSLGTWTPASAPAPSVVSVSPSSGTGLSQTFSFVFADPAGYQDFAYQQIIINSTLSPTNGCFIFYSPSGNQIYLGTNSGSGVVGPSTPGTSGTLQNSQCILNVGSSSAVGGGSNLTLNVALTFESGFTGTKTVWALTASNSGVNSGWQSVGTWAPSSPAPPTVTSVTPSSGYALSQQFSFAFADTLGAQDLAYVQIVINTTLNAAGGCYIYFGPSNNEFYLGNNSGALTLGPENGTGLADQSLQNSQCTLSESPGGFVSGNTLTLKLNLAFASSFLGNMTIFALAGSNEGLNSGWQSVGTWELNNAPSALSVSPSTGSGPNTGFDFAFYDPLGASDVASQQIIINSTLSLAGGCNFYTSVSNGDIYLYNDAGTGTIGPLAYGSGEFIANSQCSIGGVNVEGLTGAAFDIFIGFNSGFTGIKTIWGSATSKEGFTGAWQSLGLWAPYGAPPQTVTANPTSGSGLSQTFTFVFTDQLTYEDMAWQQIIINSTLTQAGGCYIYYYAPGNAAYLGTNSGSGFVGPAQVLGTSGTMQNSQCSLNVGSSSATASGNSLTLNLSLTFESGFTGTKTIWAITGSNDGLTSGWVDVGAWTP